MNDAGCAIAGCRRPHYGRGLCNLHWQRWSKVNPLPAPRYCTCTGDDTPAPYPWGECPACYRLVNTEDQ